MLYYNSSSPIRDQRRGSDMDLWRSAETSPDVYLSPATASEFLDLDSTECWSDSEFEDDELDDDGLFYSKHEQDRLSLSTNNSNSSEVGYHFSTLRLDLHLFFSGLIRFILFSPSGLCSLLSARCSLLFRVFNCSVV